MGVIVGSLLIGWVAISVFAFHSLKKDIERVDYFGQEKYLLSFVIIILGIVVSAVLNFFVLKTAVENVLPNAGAVGSYAYFGSSMIAVVPLVAGLILLRISGSGNVLSGSWLLNGVGIGSYLCVPLYPAIFFIRMVGS